MAEKAEGAEEEGFSKGVAYSVIFVERTNDTLPSIVRSPFRRRRSLKTRKIRAPTKIQGLSSIVQSTTKSQTSTPSPSDIMLRAHHHIRRSSATCIRISLHYLRTSHNLLSNPIRYTHRHLFSNNHFKRSRRKLNKAPARKKQRHSPSNTSFQSHGDPVATQYPESFGRNF